MNLVNQFLHGAIMMGFLVGALFFLRFHRSTRERLFAIFAAAFFVLAIERIVLACHHDTKCTKGHPNPDNNFHFVGANDGASAVGLLLALAPVLLAKDRDATIELVFFDGEESLDWVWNDGARALFGSKRFCRKHRDALLLGEEDRIEALVLLDMVGRTDLHLQEETWSTPRLRTILWSAAVACDTADASVASCVNIVRRGGPSRTDCEVSTNSVQRNGTSLSNSLVISRSRRADGFQAIILGGSPGR